MWQTNCYVVAAGRSAWVIDAGFDPGELIEFVNRKQLVVERVLLTHAHLDHIAGLPELRAAWPDVKTYIHPNEKRFFADPMLNLSGLFGIPITVPDADATFQQGDPLTLGGHEFHILDTPGHSPGGVTFHCPEQQLALVGDTLFAGSIGRFDFPTSDGPTLMHSIREKLLTLPDATRILPGHGPETTVGAERASNPYLQ